VTLALAEAQKTPNRTSTTGGRALALVPVFVTLLFIGLVFPRAVAPQDVPLPQIDTRTLESTEGADRVLAVRAASQEGLSDDTRILGTAVRAFLALQTTDATEAEIIKSRGDLNHAVAKVLETRPHELQLLRAAQLVMFQEAVAEYERTGVEPKDLREVGGSFVRRMTDVGWVSGSKVLPDATVRAVLFKLTWNGTLGIVNDASLEPTLDELRALYTFYIQHPHVPENRKGAIEGAKANAKDKLACDEVARIEAAAIEDWRLEKVKRLGSIDPAYPTAFALGVVHYKQGRYAASAEAFRDWMRLHPDGALAIRAQNHLKAAIAADGTL
jgi:TolA-binding protein